MQQGLVAQEQERVKSLTPEKIRKGLSLSIGDGFFASIFATLTGGAFLTGFALTLGANEFHIGIIAAIPLIGNLFQFLGSYLVNKIGHRKPVSIKSVTVGRSVWLLLAVLPFTEPLLSTSQMILLCLTIIALGHFLGAISAVAWLSWISDLVPETYHGRFFGRRNMINGMAVMSFTLLGGKFLDLARHSISGFQILFTIAVVAGVISLRYLQKIPEPKPVPGKRTQPYFKIMFHPFQDSNFRLLLLFTMVWSFGVNFAAPFFVVYKLKVLQLSYTFVAFLISLTAFLDLLGMRFWGSFSDKVGNRPVMLLCSLFAAFLPFGWLWTSNNTFSIYFLLPLLHITGGFFWAGMNLASMNILFRLAPKDQDTVYFSVYNSVNGVFAALASLAGGVLGLAVGQLKLNLLFVHLAGLKIVFLLSWAFRCLAIPLLRKVREPKGLPFVKAVQVLRSVRSINSTQGFHPLLHFFIHSMEKSKNHVENQLQFLDSSFKNWTMKLKKFWPKQ